MDPEADWIRPLWTYRMPAGVGTHYATASARVGGRTFIASPGQLLPGSKAQPGIFVIDSKGGLMYRTQEKGFVSVFPAFIRLGGIIPHLAYWSGKESDWRLKIRRAKDGRLLWQKKGYPWIGNGDFLDLDVNHDGRDELLYSMGGERHWVVCCDARTGEDLWLYDDRVTICWGRMAVADIDRDGANEIVFGTEYGNPDGTSSIIVLSPEGSLKWRYDRIRGDAGSTPAMLADVDGDGCLEVLKVEIDLCGRDGHPSSVMCFDARGSPKYSLPFGGSSIAIADVDGDGVLEGLGLTTARDGGSRNRSEMVCFDLLNATRKWSSPVPRVYLSGDPVVANLTGSDGLETIVTTGMPSGYGRIPGKEPWGEAYVFSPTGELIWRQRFPDWAGDPMACDIDQDGHNEIVIPSYEGRVCAWRTLGRADSGEFTKANGGPLRLGRPTS